MESNLLKNYLCILGNPRSGTSLLRIMLNSHKEISIPPECGFYHWLSNKYFNFDFKSIHSWLDEYLIDLKYCKKIETWNLDFINLKTYILKSQPRNYALLSILVYKYFAILNHKEPNILGDKNNYYIKHIRDLEKMNSSTKYLLIVRDCRDVVQSYLKLKSIETTSPYKPNLSTKTEIIAQEWMLNNCNALSFFYTIEKERYKVIKFENLITENKKTLLNICKWLDINYDFQMENYYIDNQKNNIEPLSTLDWKMDTLKKPLPEKIGSYKKKLTHSEISLINKISNDLLKKFNYL